MKPLEIIRKLRSTKRKPEKEIFLEQVWNDSPEFTSGVEIAYDAKYNFSFKTVPIIENVEKLSPEELGNPADFTWDDFKMLIENIIKNPSQASMLVKQAAEIAYVPEWNEWYRHILLRNLKCGLQKKSFDDIKNKLENTIQIENVIKSLNTKWVQPAIPAQCMMAEQNISISDLNITEKVWLEPIPSQQRILAFMNKQTKVIITDAWGGDIDNAEHIKECLSPILKILPISVVLDGYLIPKSWTTLMTKENSEILHFGVIDIIPLTDYNKGKSKHSTSKRHADLIKLSPIFQKQSNGIIYTIPKLSISSIGPDFKWFIDELQQAGYNQFFVKYDKGTWQLGSSSSWRKVIL
jgi:DNA ligase-1